MPLEIVTVPCLSDNYAFLAHDPQSGETALIDVPEAEPILAEARKRGWKITTVLLTHHHHDHVGGLKAVLDQHEARVVGAKADQARLPALSQSVEEGDTVVVGGEIGQVIDVSGHTVGHIAFHFPASKAAFTADSLMALGCGRVFEGTMDMMHASLAKLAALPPETMIYSGHEYTQSNGKFAITVDPDNPALAERIADVAAARDDGRPTVPSLLSLELETNPFLRANDPKVQHTLGMSGAEPARVFAEIRARKDNF